MRSVAGMKAALLSLDDDFRKKIVLHALGASTCQFTWSHMATFFKVPESEWPIQPKWPIQPEDQCR